MIVTKSEKVDIDNAIIVKTWMFILKVIIKDIVIIS